MKENKEVSIEIESEIFSLVNSINNLYFKYQEGTINDDFFQKAVKNAMNGLLKIESYLREKNIPISEFIEKMNFVKEYENAIKIFKEISNLNPSNEFIRSNNGIFSQSMEKMKSYILELPGIASEITSSFITLMDALKLEGQSHLIIKLMKELKANIKKFDFPGLEDIQLKIKKIYKKASKNKTKLVSDTQFREKIVDRLYSVLKEFQQNLNVKT
ncbi:MAG: hypothetical protein EU529_02105 [Promethearchaeota archaeon]|nr:MAG: hypothetical protein EU529_02105 [Candidatus Lokiarchaeota archaeon]